MITEELGSLNQDNYTQTFNMLTSEDEGSKIVGFSVLNNVDYEESEIFLLCMLKQLAEKDVSTHTMKTEAPVLYGKIEEYCTSKSISGLTVSFRNIYERAVERSKTKENKHEIEFLLNLFKNELLSLLTQYGFTFLEYLDIEIKQKETV